MRINSRNDSFGSFERSVVANVLDVSPRQLATGWEQSPVILIQFAFSYCTLSLFCGITDYELVTCFF